MPSSQRAQTNKIQPPRWPRGYMPWKMTVERFLEKLSRMAGMQIEILGAKRSQGGDGLSFEIDSGTAATATEAHNWQPTYIDDTTISITPGKLNGVQPASMDSVTVDDEDLNYVYLKALVTVVTNESFVTGFTLGTVSIDVSLSPQTSTDSVRYYLLFTWQTGALVTQSLRYNVGLKCEDARDSGGPGVAEWLDWVAAS